VYKLVNLCRYYLDPTQPKPLSEKDGEVLSKKPSAPIDPEELLREAEEQAEEAGADQVLDYRRPICPKTSSIRFLASCHQHCRSFHVIM
jgi:hypothetical protein